MGPAAVNGSYGLMLGTVDANRAARQSRRMPSLADTFRVLNELETEGVVLKYAVGGAMAMVFWAEPVATYDLDVFVMLPEAAQPLISLELLYAALRARGFEVSAEHVVIHGTPVQFLVSPNDLGDEAIEGAATQELEGVRFRVIRPEHLCALWLQAGGAKRRERVEVLRQSGVLDENKLATILKRYQVGR